MLKRVYFFNNYMVLQLVSDILPFTFSSMGKLNGTITLKIMKPVSKDLEKSTITPNMGGMITCVKKLSVK